MGLQQASGQGALELHPETPPSLGREACSRALHLSWSEIVLSSEEPHEPYKTHKRTRIRKLGVKCLVFHGCRSRYLSKAGKGLWTQRTLKAEIQRRWC